ncbi:outer membrane homotrimeric porin [Nitratidesulfovibrio liaohensis]|uniref:Outer membrane homotrimeric porin n=1 Tax=Nitratidesulfovibrio liaohensis TaxID=2604158 RepID=A0ABY9R1I1_9BACT|nr:outer membrane homotrimeric porin [Nitratidesulfovibrio liaohensis]WMW65176.1 outer membrane homotrimeric porin [Nitratidesulfovibrio liaohensis]
MKRFATLMLAFALVLGAISGAQAADIKAKGQWAFDFSWLDGGDYQKDHGDDFSASQRLRTQIDVVASEALKGVVFFEMGNTVWGNKDGALGADGKSVEVRRSYIDWIVPNTDLKVRMGIQGLSLPGAVAPSSMVFDDDVAGLTLSYAINDNVGVTALWARPFDSSTSGETSGQNKFDEVDMFALAVPVTLDGFKITPYGVYASVGKDVDPTTNVTNGGAEFKSGMMSMSEYANGAIDSRSETYDAWWAGAAFEMSYFAPFSLKMDAVYGSKTADDADSAERAGWIVAALAEYKLDMVTPGLLAWYGSGEDDDLDNGSERMPSVSPTGWGVTSFGFPGSVYRQDTYFGLNGAGTWAVGLQFADISFMENLSHVLRVVYMKGTNDADVIKNNPTVGAKFAPGQTYAFLTDEDSAIEVNFDTTYQIYENLKLVVEMGYIKLDMDEDTWGTDDFADAKKLVFNFVYDF